MPLRCLESNNRKTQWQNNTIFQRLNAQNAKNELHIIKPNKDLDSAHFSLYLSHIKGICWRFKNDGTASHNN